MEVVSNVGLWLYILWLLVETVDTGSKNEAINPDLTTFNDHDEPDDCHLSPYNATHLNMTSEYNSTKQVGGGRLLLGLTVSGRVLQDIETPNCSRLSIKWKWEELTTEADHRPNEQCRINTQLDLKWINRTEVGGGFGWSRHWSVMDATLILEVSGLADTPEKKLLPSTTKLRGNGRGSIQRVYKCTDIRQMAAQSDEANGHQVESKIVCSEIDWSRIQIELHMENRSEDNFSSGSMTERNYEMTCDLTQTTNAAEKDRKMEPRFAPNPSTIYVATAFGILVLCIVVVYFVIKNRRQGASYVAMGDD